MITEEHTGCEARDIQHGDLRLLEAVVGVQLVDVGPLQPVPKQRREVDQVETALETETGTFFICQQQLGPTFVHSGIVNFLVKFNIFCDIFTYINLSTFLE